MAGRPLKPRGSQGYEVDIASLQRLRTRILLGRPTRSRHLSLITASDKAVVLIDGLVECLLELSDAAKASAKE